jgi:hypothetical protein
MLLHKAVQLSPSKVRRAQAYLASRGPVGSYGRLGKAIYVRGIRGGLIKLPDVLGGTLGKLEQKARRTRAIRKGLWIGGLIVVAVLAWWVSR